MFVVPRRRLISEMTYSPGSARSAALRSNGAFRAGDYVNDIVEKVTINASEELAKLIAAGIDPELRSTLQAFCARYYAQVDPEDLQERLPTDLYGAALSHWNFARKRERGHARV